MRATQRPFPPRALRRAPSRAGVLGCAALAIACALVETSCGVRDRDALDPLCGDASARALGADVRLARPSGSAPLFDPVRDRRHEIAGRPRATVSGFRVVPLFEREIPAPGRRVHVESVPTNAALEYEAELLFAPRVRGAGSPDWTELGWVRVPRSGDDERGPFEVPFDLTDTPLAGDAVEIGLTAYVSSRRAAHAWETSVLPLAADSVLVASVGAIPAGQAAGPVAWRVLACEGESCTCVHGEVMGADEVVRTGWQERRLDLGGFAGRSVVLRLETELLGASDSASDPGLWAEPALFVRSASDAPVRRNLLVISLDTLSADHLGLYGYARDTSPFMDEVLAARGVVFANALAPATTTAPSHMTLFTSLPPSVHGAVSNLGGRPPPESVATLAETLRDAGYVTAAVTENGAITRSLGFGRGFDHYEENRSAKMVRPEGHIESTFEAGREYAERFRGLPWLVFVQTYQVHYPYSPPPEYDGLFEGDGLNALDAGPLFRGGRSAYRPVLYDREIRYTDDRLREFLTGFEAAGLLDDTVVVVLADHGEAFFEHTYLGHGADLHRETVRVPLIMTGPGLPAGRVVEERVGLGDVMPTVLELLGVASPPRVRGRSLVPLLDEDGERAPASARPIFSEAWQTTGVTRRGGVALDQPTLSVEQQGYKLIRYREATGLRHALFDLDQDSGEHTDLMADGGPAPGPAAERFESLSALLDDYQAETARLAAELGVSPDVAPEAEIDAERLEKLRALGYVE